MATITYRFKGFAAFEKEMATAPELIQAVNRDALGSAVSLVATLGHDVMPEGPGHFGYHAKERFRTTVTPLATTGIVAIDAPQARWLETGTQPHEIPHPLPSGVTITLHHPGEAARGLMRKTLRRATSAIRAMFADAVRDQVQAMVDRINASRE